MISYSTLSSIMQLVSEERHKKEFKLKVLHVLYDSYVFNNYVTLKNSLKVCQFENILVHET